MKEFDGERVTIMACSKCNINCTHCYISYKGNREPEELYSLVKALKEKYHITLNGAEVMTDLNYLKSYNEIGQNYILTNGKIFLYNNDVVRRLKENNINSISLSYHFGIQESLSQIKLNDLNRIIDIILENEFDLRLLTTISKQNLELIPYMCDEAYNIGASAIKFTNFLNQGNALNISKDYILSKEEVRRALDLIDDTRKKYLKSQLLIQRCGSFGPCEWKEKDNFYCTCITDFVVVTPDNNVYPCVFLAKPGYEIGKIIDNKIYIDEDLVNNHDRCIANGICNNGMKLIRNK